MIFFAIVLHGLWVISAVLALMSWRRLRDVGDAPDVPLAKLRPGMEARIQGRTAFHGAERTSPLGAVSAVWFDWSVLRDNDSPGFGRRLPSTLATDSSTAPFALVDDAGNRLLVWPAKAVFFAPREQRWNAEYPETMDGALRDSLLRGDNQDAPLTDPSVLQFFERWLPPGAPCFVIGRVEAPGPEHGPDVGGLIRESGDRAFLVSAGAPVDAQAALRRKTIWASSVGAVAFVLAVAATIYA